LRRVSYQLALEGAWASARATGGERISGGDIERRFEERDAAVPGFIVMRVVLDTTVTVTGCCNLAAHRHWCSRCCKVPQLCGSFVCDGERCLSRPGWCELFHQRHPCEEGRYLMQRCLALTIACLTSSPAGLLAQLITGRVLEVDSNRPIGAALVTLVAGHRSLLSTESDSAGSFRVAVPRAGWYSLRVERLGYTPATSETLEVGARENVEVAIRLSVTAIRLEPLVVVKRHREAQAMSQFERRLESGRQSGLGVFITREALDSTSAPSVTDLLSRVPLLGGGGLFSLSRGGCTPTLYLNGARFQLAADETIDDLIQPGTLEGIEIYRNRTELPREFIGIGHCGAIIFWTRTGKPGRGASWRLLVAGGTVLGLAVLFITN
jgi:hypothetical protein